MHNQLGTYKLSPIVLDKINRDRIERKSEIESFFSVTLYSDIQGKNFPKTLKSFVKRIDKKKITIDYLFRKVIDYYYSRTKVGSANEAMYLELLSYIKMKHESLPNKVKKQLKNAFQDKKSRWLEQD